MTHELSLNVICQKHGMNQQCQSFRSISTQKSQMSWCSGLTHSFTPPTFMLCKAQRRQLMSVSWASGRRTEIYFTPSMTTDLTGTSVIGQYV